MTSKTLHAIDTSLGEVPDDGGDTQTYRYKFLCHESPTSCHQPQHDDLCGMSLQRSGDGVASYGVNVRDRLRGSVGL